MENAQATHVTDCQRPTRAVHVDDRMTALDLRRERLGLTGSKTLRYPRPLPGNEYKFTVARNLIVSVLSELS